MSAVDTNTFQRSTDSSLPYFTRVTNQRLPQDDTIKVMDVLRFLFDYKWIISGVTLLGTGLSIAIAFNATPVYRAEVLMVTANEEQAKGGLSSLAGQFGGLANLAGLDLGGTSGTKSEAIATLKSRIFTEKFIKDENLLPLLFAEKWDSANNRWLTNDPMSVPSMWEAYKRFNGIRSVSEDKDKKTGLLTLAVEWKDPELAAQWANLLVSRINEILRKNAIDQAQKSMDYLKRELEKTSVVELQQGIYRLIEGQVNKIMLANVREDYAFKVVDPAVIPREKSKPRRFLIVVLGLAVGVTLGVLLSYIPFVIASHKKESRHVAIDGQAT